MILDVKQNFMDTLSKCKEIQIEDTHVNIVKGLFLSIIRTFFAIIIEKCKDLTLQFLVELK